MIPSDIRQVFLVLLSCWADGTLPPQIIEPASTSAAHIGKDSAIPLNKVPENIHDLQGHVANHGVDQVKRTKGHDHGIHPMEAMKGHDHGPQSQHKTLHSESMLDTETVHSQSRSARRRRRTAVTNVAKRAIHQNTIVSEGGFEVPSSSEPDPEKQEELKRSVAVKDQENHLHPSPSGGLLHSLLSALRMRNVIAPQLLDSNSTTVSLLSTPQAVSHSMLNMYSSDSTGIMLCTVFVFAIVCVGGAAICMAMIDSDSVESPRAPGMRLDDSGGLQKDPGGSQNPSGIMKPRPSVPPVQLSQKPVTRVSEPEARPTGPSGAPPNESQTTGQDSLCPSLVVPSGTEFVFAVQEVITTERQELSFNIVDLKGTPLSRVILSESRHSTQPKIILQTMANASLASVDTLACHQGTDEPIAICRANGALFGRIQKEPSVGRYVIRHRAGRKLLTFHGDFNEKAINVMSCITGQLVGASEKCVVDFNSASHYQVRVAPNTDAGLVICGLLAIEKLEGSRSAKNSTISSPGYH